ncbi:MAG: hypothetical protein HY366_03350 [Candidatus Aenigmarchaeota archaeon]|nr:hypothetical protein [Candidatus Aenigmarchaeota archaeon]
MQRECWDSTRLAYVAVVNVEEIRQGIPSVEQYHVRQDTLDKTRALLRQIGDIEYPKEDRIFLDAFKSLMPELSEGEKRRLRIEATELVKQEGEHSPGTHYFTPWTVPAA